MTSFVGRVAVRWLRRLTAGLVLTALAVVPASAGTSPLPAGTYLLEFFVLDDECDHFPFIGDLPESITIEVGDDGSLIMTGPEPWVEVQATVDADGSVNGAGLGAVAGFSGVSVLLEGDLVEPGVLQGTLSFGAGGELPGACPPGRVLPQDRIILSRGNSAFFDQVLVARRIDPDNPGCTSLVGFFNMVNIGRSRVSFGGRGRSHRSACAAIKDQGK